MQDDARPANSNTRTKAHLNQIPTLHDQTFLPSDKNQYMIIKRQSRVLHSTQSPLMHGLSSAMSHEPRLSKVHIR